MHKDHRFLASLKLKKIYGVKKAQGMPTDTIIIVIIALLVLAMVFIFYSIITGKYIFPSLVEKVKTILGLWNSTKLPGQ